MKRWKKRLFIKLPLALVALSVLWVLALKVLPVYYTPLMFKRAYQNRYDDEFYTRHKWVPVEDISSNMMKAVIASEDNRFATHNGFDTTEIRKMYQDHLNKGKQLRGCSTISQQTAKNVFTFCSDTWWRKGVEAYYTFLIEKIWGKERIMEVYLNSIEMGRGIYGVEAASRYYYGKPASDLSLRQAGLIAACLPNPIKRRPDNKTSYLANRSMHIVNLTYKIAYPDWVYHKHPEKGKDK